ncbi:MAG: hypothetical protein GY711_04510 [bacterium]|nr:hypothetical protein [bacterium]
MSNEKITGPQKVAAFLLSLDQEVATKVMRHLDPKVVPEIAAAMTELDPEICTPEAVDELLSDLKHTLLGGGGVEAKDDVQLFAILDRSFGVQEAERVIRDIHDRRRKAQPFAFLDNAAPDALARVLSEESPAVVALVLAHASPAVSARVLGSFDEETSLDIVKRMTSISPPAVETMLAIADDLQQRMRASAAIPSPPSQEETLRTVADLMNFSDGETERVVLEGLETIDEEVAKQVRDFMFTWTDLGTIDKRAMQKILASVDTRTLSMSLKACPPDVEANIMDNLSSRVREMVADERDLSGAVPFSEVQEARAEIMNAVRALIEAGEFAPAKSGEELVT